MKILEELGSEDIRLFKEIRYLSFEYKICVYLH